MRVFLTPFGSRSYHVAAGNQVSQNYTFTAGEWTEVTNPSDLAYLLSNDSCVLREKEPLGDKVVLCNCDGLQARVRFDDPALNLEYYEEYEKGKLYKVPLHIYKVLKKRNGFREVTLAEMAAAYSEVVSPVQLNMRILIIRHGGLGDVLLSLPTLSTLKRVLPDCEIVYACDERNKRLLLNNPSVTRAVNLEEAYEYRPYDYVADWTYPSQSVEDHPLQETVPRPDLFGILAGFDELDDHKMPVFVQPSEAEEAAKLLPDKHPLVAVGVRGANWMRMMSSEKLIGILGRMVDAGMTPVCLHYQHEAIWDIDGVVNLTGQTDTGLLIAVMNACDAVLTGDTGPTHLANALNKPTLALYGHVDNKLRIVDQPNCTIIQGNRFCGCPPCNSHQYKFCTPPAQCLEQIPDDLIMDELGKVLERACY
ncbi:MAG: glycosyltransferase family 9 protein [Deltaproteobacteria bacterium]|nr:glycosyltransferase family 9 protein [Deltaproteobacteria bacterium]